MYVCPYVGSVERRTIDFAEDTLQYHRNDGRGSGGIRGGNAPVCKRGDRGKGGHVHVRFGFGAPGTGAPLGVAGAS